MTPLLATGLFLVTGWWLVPLLDPAPRPVVERLGWAWLLGMGALTIVLLLAYR